jgi:hypothetical protein
MFSKLICCVIAIQLILNFVPASAGAQTKQEQKETAKIKQKVEKLGVNPQTKIEVTMRKGKDFKGYISQVGEDSFVVTNSENSASTTVRYEDVLGIRKPWPLWLKVAIPMGIAAGVLAWLAVFSEKD